KKFGKALNNWSWNTFTNIINGVEKAEKEVQAVEKANLLGQVDEASLLEANEKLLTTLDMQEQLLKQKVAKIKFSDGEKNTMYYHACINYRSKFKTIHSIKGKQGKWIKDEDGIAASTVEYCQQLMHRTNNKKRKVDSNLFISDHDLTTSIQLAKVPDEEEIKQALDSIDNFKAAGPDGFTADFYKKAWEKIKED
ncbi:uncharacterized protein LOC110036490, partial [Phalaenopsis equestris]|uniref:uncharacterized protein LOC110036490 n=1 Tax=Phalaenopsis equestris TaxID=78828 RepID=UPI0009E54C12